MHRGDRDAVAGQLPCPEWREHELHPLRAGVCRRARVGARGELRVVDVQPLRVGASGRHEHDAASALERLTKAEGEHVWAEDVRRESELVPLCGRRALRRHDSRVVDDGVQTGHPGSEVAGELRRRGQIADVGDVRLDRGARQLGEQFASRRVEAPCVPPGDVDRGAQSGKPASRREAQSAAGTRHEDMTPGEGVRRRVRRPPGPSHGGPDPRVAEHHRLVHRPVDCRLHCCEHHGPTLGAGRRALQRAGREPGAGTPSRPLDAVADCSPPRAETRAEARRMPHVYEAPAPMATLE